MMNTRTLISRVSFLFVLSVFVLAGCQPKKEEPVKEQPKTEQVAPKPDTTQAKPAEPVAPALSLKGKWSGKLAGYGFVMNITEETTGAFTGKVTNQTARPTTKQVSGKFDASTKKFTMMDTSGGAEEGNYEGTISEDGKSISGTFTLKSGGNPMKFSVKLK